MVRNSKIVFTIILLFSSTVVLASEKDYFVAFFVDKDTIAFEKTLPQAYLSERAIERRSKQQIPITVEDFPVNPAYVQALKDLGVEVRNTSKWFKNFRLKFFE